MIDSNYTAYTTTRQVVQQEQYRVPYSGAISSNMNPLSPSITKRTIHPAIQTEHYYYSNCQFSRRKHLKAINMYCNKLPEPKQFPTPLSNTSLLTIITSSNSKRNQPVAKYFYSQHIQCLGSSSFNKPSQSNQKFILPYSAVENSPAPSNPSQFHPFPTLFQHRIKHTINEP